MFFHKIYCIKFDIKTAEIEVLEFLYITKIICTLCIRGKELAINHKRHHDMSLKSIIFIQKDHVLRKYFV
jgi:hypothetical protein